MFGNLVAFERGGPEVYPGISPINGVSSWRFEWGEAAEGPLTVFIDQQPFPGTGVWGETECGTFTARFDGTWVAPGGRSHTFTAVGNFLYYDILIEGSLAWSETWNDAGITGALEASDAAVSGRQFGP